MMVGNVKVVLRWAVFGWGKYKVPSKDREYNIWSINDVLRINTAVGTFQEMKDYFREQGYKVADFVVVDKNRNVEKKNVKL